uniref:Cation/H+ exchanger domain-containing protein n=1 Tax=Lotharella globosa TaxID=91324 RepID=A0A7S3YH22_9EUKA
MLRLSCGGVLLGFGCGTFRAIFNAPAAETAITLAMAYITFWIAESNDLAIHVSGVLATVVLGLFLSRFRAYVSVKAEEPLHAFWETVSYLINTLIFFISGILVAEKLFSGSEHIHLADAGWLILLYVLLHIVRTLTLLILSPLLYYMGYGFDWKSGCVVVYGGLRGAVSLALALIVELDTNIEESIRHRILFHVAGIVRCECA